MIKRATSAAATAAPAAVGNQAGVGRSFTPAAKGTKPSLVLKYKDETGKWQLVTGLFESENKNGEVFYKGTNKESGISYIVAPYSEKKRG